MSLRAKSPPPTSRVPAPSAHSEAALLPPVFGSSALAGAGAGAGAGGAGGAAFGGAGGGGGGGFWQSPSALATTPPALASGHSPPLAEAPPAVAEGTPSLSSALGPFSTPAICAMAGEAASSATATIATNNINFLNFYLLIVFHWRRTPELGARLVTRLTLSYDLSS